MAIALHLAFVLLTSVLLYILFATVRACDAGKSSAASEAYADPTRAQQRDHSAGRRRVSDTERTKLFNPGGRKGSV